MSLSLTPFTDGPFKVYFGHSKQPRSTNVPLLIEGLTFLFFRVQWLNVDSAGLIPTLLMIFLSTLSAKG